MSIPRPTYLFRIVHIDNLPSIFNVNEITCPSHDNANPEYIGIGDDSLIAHRKTTPVTLEPGGTFSDYVAFYFTTRSPMLYNIKNGYQGVTQRSQDEIVYLVTSFEKIVECNIPYIIYDGHAYHHLSQPFNTVEGLEHVDWTTISSGKWFDTEEDPDRKRRKQAELLVYRALPFEAILVIATYSEAARQKVHEMPRDYNKEPGVVVKKEWYY